MRSRPWSGSSKATFTRGLCASCAIQASPEDLTVETLWRIYRARQQFRPDGNFACLGATDRHQPGARLSPPQSPGTEFARGASRTASARSSPSAGDSEEDPAGISQTAGQAAGGGDARSCGRAALRRNCRCLGDVDRRCEVASFPCGSHPAQTTEPPWGQALSGRT